jgi:hypothetical protein
MATPDTANPVSQVLNTAVAAAGDMPEQLQEGLMSAQAALEQMLRGYLGQFQEYIGESGELALAAVLGTAYTAVSGEEGLLTKREIVEKVSRFCCIAPQSSGRLSFICVAVLVGCKDCRVPDDLLVLC